MSDNLDPARKIIQGAVHLALKTVVDIMKSPGRNSASQLHAAQDILDRAGLRAPRDGIMISNSVSTTVSNSASTSVPRENHRDLVRDPELQKCTAEQLLALRDHAVMCRRLGVPLVINWSQLGPATAEEETQNASGLPRAG